MAPAEKCYEASDTVSAMELPAWNKVPFDEVRDFAENEANHSTSPFDISTAINQKLVVYQGDLTKLLVDAVVNPTNEHLNDKNSFSKRIFEFAGPQLCKELQEEVKFCRTGEARLTQGYDMLCRHIVHTVGPKYQQKYLSASESALHSSYRTCLNLMKEHGIKTIAVPPLHSSRRGFPPVEGAHLALRTIRRFLEEFAHDDCIQRIVLVLEKVDAEIYSLLMPLYFPRCKTEQDKGLYGLPKDLGGRYGEPVIPERQIRIQEMPFFMRETPQSDMSETDPAMCMAKSSFARMQNDIDQKRRTIRTQDTLTSEITRQNRYERLLRKSKEVDFREIREANILYKSGVDKQGRSVFIFVGRNYSPAKVSFDILCAYIIRLMDKEVAAPFCIIYLHSSTTSRNHVPYTILRELYQTMDYRYKKNLHALYIVHPTLWSRLSLWWFTTITTSGLTGKVRLLGGVEYLYAAIHPDQLTLPQFVLDYDYSVNGARYCELTNENLGL